MVWQERRRQDKMTPNTTFEMGGGKGCLSIPFPGNHVTCARWLHTPVCRTQVRALRSLTYQIVVRVVGGLTDVASANARRVGKRAVAL